MKRVLVILLLSAAAYAQTNGGVSPSSVTPPDPGPVQTQDETSPDPRSLLSEPLPLPQGKASLIGGMVTHLDRVRDQMTIQVFGGKNMKLLFDGRTRVYRDGTSGSFRDLQEGQRVYLDTQLDGTKVFARNIRVVTHTATGDSSGQVLKYDAERGQLILRDSISPEPIRLRVDANTRILNGERVIPASDLQPGTLVSVRLTPDGSGRGVAREISILATPGSKFIFSGRVTFLDLHNGIIAVVDPRDKKRYEVRFDPSTTQVSNDLREGADVTLVTDFDGTRYLANAIMVNTPGHD